jgi:hypothetical protein
LVVVGLVELVLVVGQMVVIPCFPLLPLQVEVGAVEMPVTVAMVVLEVGAITTPAHKLAVLELLTKVITAEMVQVLFLEAAVVVRVP